MSRSIYSSKGQVISLGKKIASGGEGYVSEVTNAPNLVAKIFHKAIPEKTEKLKVMATLSTDPLLRLAAWPTDTLHDRPHGNIIGFLMPRVAESQLIHSLYGPKTRREKFPHAGWPFLVHVAMNTARAIATLHQHGHIVGDINHSNILVSDKATVVLIDCDSFQINTANKIFRCGVGAPEYTPPELQGINFDSINRTKNHDAFGLAVVIFQLLFMGRHPFAGRFLGQGDDSLEKAIKEYRFAYGNSAHQRQMQQPPATPSLSILSPQIALLLERAFGKEGSQNGTRPPATDWIKALEQLAKSLITCSTHNGHHFFNSLKSCPWCEIEALSGISYFTFRNVAGQTTGTQLDAIESLWRMISGIPDPAPSPTLPTTAVINATPSAIVIEQKPKRRNWFIYLLHISDNNKKTKTVRDALALAQKNWMEFEKLWYHDKGYVEFVQAKSRLHVLKKEYEDIEKKRIHLLKELEIKREANQRKRFLESIHIREGSISGVGPSKIYQLNSYNIYSAADIEWNKVINVPGFGEVLTQRVLQWKQLMESRFKFDPNKGIDPRDVTNIENMIANEKSKVIAQLRNGPSALKSISQQIEMRRQELKAVMDNLLLQLAQAEVDLKYLTE